MVFYVCNWRSLFCTNGPLFVLIGKTDAVIVAFMLIVVVYYVCKYVLRFIGTFIKQRVLPSSSINIYNYVECTKSFSKAEYFLNSIVNTIVEQYFAVLRFQ